MKKNIKYALVAVLAAFGLASCDKNDYEYATPEAVAGSQVYFPLTNESTIELDQTEGTFVIPVTRIDTTAALTAALTTTCSSDKYVVDEVVSFEANQKNSAITVKFSDLEYDVMDTLIIKLDNAVTTPYGGEECVLLVGAPAPWTPWCNTKAQWVKAGYDADAWPLSETEGTCTYTYTQIFSGDDTGLPIWYRQSTIDPTQAQIRVDNWCYGVSLILDFNPETNNIQIEPQFSGFTDSGVGDFYITDVSHWQGKDYYASYPCKYDPSTGLILLTTAWMAGDNHSACYGYGAEYIQLDGFYIPDYSVSVEFDGILTDKSQNVYAQVFADFGVDVESVKAYIAKKSDDASAVADALAAGDVEGLDIVKGINKLPIGDLTGELKVVLAAIAGGEAVDVAEANFEYYGGGAASPWKSLGMGLYTEGLVADMYGIQSLTYEVEIKESTEKPGLYRIMDPYGEAWGYASANKSTPCDFLEINACDPEGVYIEPQMLGVNLDGTELGMASMGGFYLANGNSFEDVKEYGYMGTLKDGVITLPTFTAGEGDDAYDFQGICIYGDKTYRSLVGFKVVLPEAVGSAAVKKSAKANLGKPGKVRNSHMIDRKAKKVNPFLSVKSFRK